MNNGISVIFKKYVLAAIIVALGIFLLIYGMRGDTQQDSLFNIAAINIVIGGVLALLLSSGILSRAIVVSIAVICLVVTVYLGYQSYDSVSKTYQHIEDRKLSMLRTNQSLIEIRDMQKAYFTANQKYAGSWDELKDFYENGSIMEAVPVGSVPTRPITKEERTLLYGKKDNRALDLNMTEWEATRLSRLEDKTGIGSDLLEFKRDTVAKKYKDIYLRNKRYKKSRKNYNMGSFNLDSVNYVPMTGGKDQWVITALDSAVIVGDTLAVVQVVGLEPVAKSLEGKRQKIGFGNIKDGTLKGTWE